MLMRHREKLIKLDAKRREYDIIVIGDEGHLAYNRVGLTSFFQHRKVENLYLNPKEWVGFLSNFNGLKELD
jgi:nitrite reductase (NAD(P)H)